MPYLFVEPTYNTPEATAMLKPLNAQVYSTHRSLPPSSSPLSFHSRLNLGRVDLAMRSLHARLLEPDVAHSPWRALDFPTLFKEHFASVGSSVFSTTGWTGRAKRE